MRNIAFSMTTAQVRDRTKDVTRRIGWANLKPGERLQACVKCMGRKNGEPLERLCVIEVVKASRERLDALLEPTRTHAEALDELRREGFPELSVAEFLEMFRDAHRGCVNSTILTRIEFRYT